MQKANALSNTVLLSVYELFIDGTPIGGDDPSASDAPDIPVEPRGIDADMERSPRSPQPIHLRHGGVLRSSKRNDNAVVVKRDVAVKPLFGL